MSMPPDTQKFFEYAEKYGVYDDDEYLIGIKQNSPTQPKGKAGEYFSTYDEFVEEINNALKDGVKL